MNRFKILKFKFNWIPAFLLLSSIWFVGTKLELGSFKVEAKATLAIHSIQGSGTTSPELGNTVTTTGIVTALKSNGFFIQTPDAEVDLDPNTSEGILVFFGGGTKPVDAIIGNQVSVTGKVTEYIPSADQNSPPLTEIIAPSSMVPLVINKISSGNTLPSIVTITAADTSPTGSIEQLEKYEGMRVKVNSLTAVSGSGGNKKETDATSTSNGVFYAVITGIARPFRETGIQVPDPLPTGAPITIPRFDANPERLQVNTTAQIGSTVMDVTTGAIITNITGVLDYSYRTYTILSDPGIGSFTGNKSASPVPTPEYTEVTVASFNMERFYDTTDDPKTSDVVLTPAAFNIRLNKASLAIRNIMQSPDIIGVEEMENLSTLQAVATKLNNDIIAAGKPNPNYQAYLEEGNDVGGIDVGFLVKSSTVNVTDVKQEGKATTYTYPNPKTGMTEVALLNDRPSLVLRATMHPVNGVPIPITVIVNHLRSLLGMDDPDPVTSSRVRVKRKAQAEFLANLIQARQIADPNEHIVSIGDYNAFQINDGYVDTIGTIKGSPAPASEVVLSSSDLVNPNLVNLIDYEDIDQRYSYTFGGNAQTLDQVLVTQNLMPHFNRCIHAHNNADFPEIYRGDSTRPERISDHDMPVIYFSACPSIKITPDKLPDGIQCITYLDESGSSIQFIASGGISPYKFSAVEASKLPQGLNLSFDGKLSGTPALSGNTIFDVIVTDNKGCRIIRKYNLNIISSIMSCGDDSLAEKTITK